MSARGSYAARLRTPVAWRSRARAARAVREGTPAGGGRRRRVADPRGPARVSACCNGRNCSAAVARKQRASACCYGAIAVPQLRLNRGCPPAAMGAIAVPQWRPNRGRPPAATAVPQSRPARGAGGGLACPGPRAGLARGPRTPTGDAAVGISLNRLRTRLRTRCGPFQGLGVRRAISIASKVRAVFDPSGGCRCAGRCPPRRAVLVPPCRRRGDTRRATGGDSYKRVPPATAMKENRLRWRYAGIDTRP